MRPEQIMASELRRAALALAVTVELAARALEDRRPPDELLEAVDGPLMAVDQAQVTLGMMVGQAAHYAQTVDLQERGA